MSGAAATELAYVWQRTNSASGGWTNLPAAGRRRWLVSWEAPAGADPESIARTIAEINPAEVWVTHGREEALVRWCALRGTPARPLHMVGYEEEAE